ncbi:MAG: hypothetical protein AB7Q45_03010, partial [Planctomycetaceae bacterium]
MTSPWWVPAAMVGDEYTREASFPAAPYADAHDGYLAFGFDNDDWTRPLAIRYASEYGNDLSGLERVGGRLQLDTASRFGLDTEWNSWREEIPGGHDTLWTGDANLTFRFAQSEHAQFYTGLGVNWLDGGESDVGFNFMDRSETLATWPGEERSRNIVRSMPHALQNYWTDPYVRL